MGLGSGIRKKPIPDPGSRGQKDTGSRIRNTGYLEVMLRNLPSRTPDKRALDPRSGAATLNWPGICVFPSRFNSERDSGEVLCNSALTEKSPNFIRKNTAMFNVKRTWDCDTSKMAQAPGGGTSFSSWSLRYRRHEIIKQERLLSWEKYDC